MPTRFVILHHKTDGGEHYDLMLEQGEVLLTWQLPYDPGDGSRLPIPAKRIGDHRKAYLTYEGPVSDNRGQVRRIDSGTVEFNKITAEEYLVRLQGERLQGRFRLTRQSEGDINWSLDRAGP